MSKTVFNGLKHLYFFVKSLINRAFYGLFSPLSKRAISLEKIGFFSIYILFAVTGHIRAEESFPIIRHCGGKNAVGIELKRVWAGPYHDFQRFSLIFGHPDSARRSLGSPPFYEITHLQSAPDFLFIKIWSPGIDERLFSDSFVLLDKPPYTSYAIEKDHESLLITLAFDSAQNIQIVESQRPTSLIIDARPARLRGGTKSFYFMNYHGENPVSLPPVYPFKSSWHCVFSREGKSYYLYGARISKREREIAWEVMRDKGFDMRRISLHLPPYDPTEFDIP